MGNQTNNVKYTHIYTGQQLGGYNNRDTHGAGVRVVRIDSNITTIQEYAFLWCSNLTYINIPNSVTSIEECAFFKCSRLKSITIPSSVKTISEQAFWECSSLEAVNIPSSLTEISPFTFYGCKKLKSITIPSSVETIGKEAFAGCSNLEIINVSASTRIDPTAFIGCGKFQSNVEYTHTYTVDGVLGGGGRDDVKSVRIDSTITRIQNEAFWYCKNLTVVDEIHDGITSIENFAFNGCSSLKSITIPLSVKRIGEYAFSKCTSLENINIPASVTEIRKSTFDDCVKLSSITIPPSVKVISEDAFWNCKSLENVDISTPTEIHPDAFDSCKNLNNQSIAQILGYSTTLHDSFQQGGGPKYDFQGSTQAGYGPEMWGLTLQQIKNIRSHPAINFKTSMRPGPGYYHESTSMRNVVERVIKPATKGLGIGYSLLINQEQPLRAKVMVSHAWEETLDDFITCLENSGEEGPYWVCAFSIFQNQGEDDKPTIADQLGPNPEFGPFATVLKQADIMIAVVTTLCDIYTRLWCVYELFVAWKLGVEVKLFPHIGDDAVKKGCLDEDVCIKNINKSVDSENALCSMESDLISIHKAITSHSPNGFHELNKIVEMIRLAHLLEYPVHKITGHDWIPWNPNNSISAKKERRRRAVEQLVTSITTMLGRVHSIPVHKVPTFENIESHSEPIEKFLEWKKLVEFVISDKAS